MALNAQWSNQLIGDLMRDFPGLSLGAAQGIAGPFAMESKGFQDWQEDRPVVPGSRGGGGMAQWTGVRRTQYESYVKKNGLVLDSYEAQYGYLREELKGVGGHDRGLIKKLEGVTDPYEAGRITTKTFLRPGVVNQAARNEWTTQVISSYAPLPAELTASAGKLNKKANGVGTEIDVVESQLPDLMRIAPVPMQRPEQFSYAGNGAPIDSATGLLMPRKDPRYAKATGRLNMGQGPDGVGLMPTMKGVERLADGRTDKDWYVRDFGIKARLPEVAPPANAPKPAPGQSQIERNPPKLSSTQAMKPAPRPAKQNEIDVRIAHGVQTESQLRADAQMARDEIMASEAARIESKPATKPGISRADTARNRAMQQEKRAEVRLPDLKEIAPGLPNGSRPQTTGFTYARDTDLKLTNPADPIKNSPKKREALIEDPTRIIVTNKDLAANKKEPKKQKPVVAALPELPMESITSANKPTPNGNTLGDSDDPDIFKSMGKVVDTMFGGMLSGFGLMGGESGKDKPAGYRRPENNNAGGVGGFNYKPATGTGSRGYTSIESDSHRYNRESGTWEEK